jgi:hypothetical protein
MFNLFNCLISWESVGPFTKIFGIVSNSLKPSGNCCITSVDKKRNARFVAHCWIGMFASEIVIVQYGSMLGLNLAPLKKRDYGTTMVIGVGSMVWYIATLEVWKRFKREGGDTVE